jgi:RNA polymerase sigma-70 factor (ECF subfamily)
LPPHSVHVNTEAYRGAEDAYLIERCRASADEAAFAELVRRYHNPVFRLAVSILGQGFVHDAEDVAQDVLVRVYHALSSFRGDATFGSWVYRIAFNHTLNVKARMRYRAPHVGDEALAGVPSDERSAYDQLQAAQRSRAMMESIAELPEVYQSALRLHYWMGASMSEIATLLDAPENTVKSYLHRARRLLQAMLAERGFHA